MDDFVSKTKQKLRLAFQAIMNNMQIAQAACQKQDSGPYDITDQRQGFPMTFEQDTNPTLMLKPTIYAVIPEQLWEDPLDNTALQEWGRPPPKACCVTDSISCDIT
uniref:Uncharacterized protein n=1 Tax=Romanomermis culicivorax TaxID=13658 RepID=A0A915JW73_ROMCU